MKHNLVFLFFLNFLLSTTMSAQSSVVEGKITDAAGLALPGVNIQEKGTKNGTSTDFEGSFKINVTNKNAILIVSYLGFQTKEVSIAGKTKVNVSLSEETNTLTEVVVVGYGTAKKTDLTGAINTLNAAKITERNVTNPMEAIQGGIAGVQVTSNTGRIGDGFNVIIRGANSINKDGSGPLFVVDGVPTDNINFLNPQDIARIDVLKDASSAAIYGSRGGSGVVIVTTKSGTNAKEGVSVSYESSYGNKQAVRLPKLMSPDKWWYYHQSAFLATTISATNPTYNDIDATELNTAVGQAGTNPVLYQRVANNQTYNWQDAVLKGGMTSNNYLNITGRANSGLTYNIGLGTQEETGVIDNEGINKYNFKLGVNHKLSDKISFGVNLTISKTDEELGSPIAMQEAFRQNPFTSPWAIDAAGNEIIGTYNQQPGTLRYPNGALAINKTGSYNPLLEIANSQDNIKRFTTIGNIFAEYKVNSWLSFKTTFSAGKMDAREGRSFGAQTDFGLKNKSLPSGDVTNMQNFNYTWDNQFNINYTLKNDHVFSLLGLQSFYSNTTETYFAASRENPFETGFYNLGSGAQSTYTLTPGSGTIALIPSGIFVPYSKNTLESYAARFNYAYKGRYLLTASVRYDGSSVLSEDNKWTSFPSVALGWNLHQESFMKSLSFISNFKLRASIGYTGNDKVKPYSSLSLLKTPTYYDFNGVIANGFTASSLGNTDLTWEKTKEVNLGLDFGFAKNRISGSVDVYDRKSKSLLFQQALPLEIGVPVITANVGSVSNKGVEVALTTKNVQTRNVTWETSFTFTKNVNKLLSIYGQDLVDDVGNNLFIGENVHSYYNYVFDGVWQESEAAQAASYGQKPGEAKVKDLNNDGKIDANNDRAILGNYDPKWSGSFSTSLKVKQFDLGISIITNQGMTVFSGFHDNFADVTDRGRQKLDLGDWYVPANGAGIPAQYSNTNPLPRGAGVYYDTNNVAFYKDASFVKVQNIALGYSFDPDLVNKLKIKSLRLYVNVLNPFVFTNYEGYDPEWATAPLALNRVATMTVQMGLSLKF
ncbi:MULTISPECIES: TonB-dependent receptor [unclassified Flavobacterium]|uniref:SusC/RagA family TonB-linked outer membrane protein n=1 Tax=unclassified Flavobacterium TaxID=196869 RepID=UPI001E309B58|nr:MULTISPECIES: TonB-dependent receptor [unclassified Flavobacterium]